MKKNNIDLEEDFENEVLDTDLDEAKEDKAEKYNKGTIKSSGKPKQDMEEIDEEDNLEEAAYISKSELIAKMVDYASKLPKDHLAQSVEKIIHDAEEIAKHNKSNVKPDDESAFNKGTIKSAGAPGEKKPAVVKEDLEAIFGSEDLSEDFREKTETLFEAAVKTRMAILEEELVETYEARLQEAIEENTNLLEEYTKEVFEELEEKVAEYLNYVAKTYVEENEIAIRSNIRTEITESFLSGLKTLFTEHYIEIPDDKIDVVEELADRVSELEEEVNEHANRAFELQKEIREATHRLTVAEMSEGLTDTQKAKFADLVEEYVGMESDETFKKKAGHILESFSTKVKRSSEEDLNEEVEINENVTKVASTPEMEAYRNAISRFAKSKI